MAKNLRQPVEWISLLWWMLIRRYFRTDRNNNLDVWAAISAWNALVIYLFSFGSCTLCISLCIPHIHTLELCCCSCDSANCISQNPLPGGSIRFCQRDAIKGNWKWNTAGRVFIPVFQLLLQYFSCRQLALATGFFCTPQQLCYTSEIQQISFRRDGQRRVRPCAPTLKAMSFLRSPSTRLCGGSLPHKSLSIEQSKGATSLSSWFLIIISFLLLGFPRPLHIIWFLQFSIFNYIKHFLLTWLLSLGINSLH